MRGCVRPRRVSLRMCWDGVRSLGRNRGGENNKQRRHSKKKEMVEKWKNKWETRKATSAKEKGKKRKACKRVAGVHILCTRWKKTSTHDRERVKGRIKRRAAHSHTCASHAHHAALALMWNLSARRRSVAGSGTETTARTRRTVRSTKTAVNAAKDAHALRSAKMSG